MIKQIGLPLRGRPILLNTRMITDRIRLHSVLLPLLITLRSSKYNLRHDYILSLPKVNTTKYGLKSWTYFAAKKWNELANDIRIKAGTSEVKNKIRLLIKV